MFNPQLSDTGQACHLGWVCVLHHCVSSLRPKPHTLTTLFSFGKYSMANPQSCTSLWPVYCQDFVFPARDLPSWSPSKVPTSVYTKSTLFTVSSFTILCNA